MTTPGWHPDPSGKHQHRFWDGTKWTDQVADGGVAANDPIAPPSPAETQSATPPPTQGKRSAPMMIGLGLLVVLVVGGGLLLITRDGGSGGGAGEFTLEVTSDRITAHEIQAKAGDHIALHFDNAHRINAMMGIDRDSYPDLVGVGAFYPVDVRHLFGPDSYSDWGEHQEAFSDQFSDELSDPSGDIDAWPELPGYGGIPIFPEYGTTFHEGYDIVGWALIAPVDGTYAVLFTSDGATRDVQLSVEITRPDRVPESFGTDDLTDFYSDDFYSGLLDDYASEHDLDAENSWG